MPQNIFRSKPKEKCLLNKKKFLKKEKNELTESLKFSEQILRRCKKTLIYVKNEQKYFKEVLKNLNRLNENTKYKFYSFSKLNSYFTKSENWNILVESLTSTEIKNIFDLQGECSNDMSPDIMLNREYRSMSSNYRIPIIFNPYSCVATVIVQDSTATLDGSIITLEFNKLYNYPTFSLSFMMMRFDDANQLVLQINKIGTK